MRITKKWEHKIGTERKKGIWEVNVLGSFIKLITNSFKLESSLRHCPVLGDQVCGAQCIQNMLHFLADDAADVVGADVAVVDVADVAGVVDPDVDIEAPF